VERFAAALAELAVEAGDVVSIQLPNWWQALALGLACWRRGAVLASVMTTIRSRERTSPARDWFERIGRYPFRPRSQGHKRG
jgi:acyl-coenzyme A synthetase/AMP-(fatty) acid ligase